MTDPPPPRLGPSLPTAASPSRSSGSAPGDRDLDLLTHRFPPPPDQPPLPRSSQPHPHANAILLRGRRPGFDASAESVHLEVVKRGLTRDVFLSIYFLSESAPLRHAQGV
ncbi:hypothetical protein GUJ93_ZPchr0008g11476 [Zizania palustris]|uniref:Uncharacterized protein n=1 Tax=Zizania palustris TaxID=103762 RepID=A0A8J5RGW8_ZIZPA|nr:hypothetical protein GUJ93_ZPchr0008g11476 [Zizania palustris]